MDEPAPSRYGPNSVEAVIFKLASVLGGRGTVLESPAEEILAYLDLQNQKEEAAAKKEQLMLYTQFLISVYSQPPREGEDPRMTQNRQQFIDNLIPKGLKKKKTFGWDNIPAEVLAEAEKQKQIGGEE